MRRLRKLELLFFWKVYLVLSSLMISARLENMAMLNVEWKLSVFLMVKREFQVLSVSESTASVMDLESFETIDLPFSEDIKGELAEEKQVEYWEIEGQKKIMRIL